MLALKAISGIHNERASCLGFRTTLAACFVSVSVSVFVSVLYMI